MFRIITIQLRTMEDRSIMFQIERKYSILFSKFKNCLNSYNVNPSVKKVVKD